MKVQLKPFYGARGHEQNRMKSLTISGRHLVLMLKNRSKQAGVALPSLTESHREMLDEFMKSILDLKLAQLYTTSGVQEV